MSTLVSAGRIKTLRLSKSMTQDSWPSGSGSARRPYPNGKTAVTLPDIRSAELSILLGTSDCVRCFP